MFSLEIDHRQLSAIGQELNATPKQVALSVKRAARRTAGTLRKLSEREMRDELQLKTIANARRRLKAISKRDVEGVWFGLNDMPVPRFKGRPSQTSSGAAFRGQSFPGGFIRRNKRGELTIFKRQGRARLPVVEQGIPVKDRLDPIIERKLFGQIEGIFWRHFEKDLAARVKFKIGRTE